MRLHLGGVHRRTTSLRRPVAAVLVAVVLTTAFALTPADAQSVADKEAEAAQVSAELTALEQELSALDEQFNQANLRLTELEDDITEAEGRVEAATAELAGIQGQLRALAVQAYVTNGDATTLDAMMGGEASGIGERKTYVEVATGSRQDVLDQLAAVQQRTDAEIADLEAVRSEASAAQAQADAARDQASSAVAAHESLQSQVQGELADLVAAEQARQAAAAQAAAEEAAAERAAQQATQATTQATQATTATTATATATPQDEPLVPTTQPPSPAPPVSGDVGAVIAAATSQVGTPYVWAGASPSQGFDCSGFTMWAWSHGGKSLPHSAAAQMGMTRRISISQLQPGDLVFYGVPVVHHVALYIGGGTIVHAPGRGRFVRYDSVHYWSELVGAGRL